jgi:hypothetical protein
VGYPFPSANIDTSQQCHLPSMGAHSDPYNCRYSQSRLGIAPPLWTVTVLQPSIESFGWEASAQSKECPPCLGSHRRCHRLAIRDAGEQRLAHVCLGVKVVLRSPRCSSRILSDASNFSDSVMRSPKSLQACMCDSQYRAGHQ